MLTTTQRNMMENTPRNQTIHRRYTRPVFFVADVTRAARSYVEMLGFEKRWHEGDGGGKVCQVSHGECEIITARSCSSPVQSEQESNSSVRHRGHRYDASTLSTSAGMGSRSIGNEKATSAEPFQYAG